MGKPRIGVPNVASLHNRVGLLFGKHFTNKGVLHMFGVFKRRFVAVHLQSVSLVAIR